MALPRTSSSREWLGLDGGGGEGGIGGEGAGDGDILHHERLVVHWRLLKWGEWGTETLRRSGLTAAGVGSLLHRLGDAPEQLDGELEGSMPEDGEAELGAEMEGSLDGCPVDDEGLVRLGLDDGLRSLLRSLCNVTDPTATSSEIHNRTPESHRFTPSLCLIKAGIVMCPYVLCDCTPLLTAHIWSARSLFHSN